MAHDVEAFSDRYRVVGLLGTGATATVYEALDVERGERVAVKVLRTHLATSPAARAAFLREAVLLRGVSHPALCAAVDAGVSEEEGRPRVWTVWELAEGQTLSSLVREHGPLAAGPAATVGALVGEGLAVLHRAGLVHRDISPANVVVDVRDGEVRSARLIDVGLLGPAGHHTRGGDVLRSTDDDAGVVGNPRYASPELLRGEAVGPATDIYELGATLVFALTGESPFPRASSAEAVRAHQTAVPPTVSARAPRTPPALDRAIARSLMKEVDARFGSADEMVAALRACGAAGTGRGAEAAGASAAVLPELTRVLPVEQDGAATEETRPARGPIGLAAGVLVAAVVAGILAVTVLSAPPPSRAGADTVVSEASPSPSATVSVPAPVVPETGPSPSPTADDVVVPPVEGVDAATAIAALRAAGLESGEVVARSSARAGGTVLSSEPDAGTTVARGSIVVLVVASGANSVPDLAGMASAEALAALQAAGFSASMSEEPGGVADRVVRSHPAPSVDLPLGSTVVVVVSRGEPRPTAPATPTPAPTTATPVPAPTDDAGM